MMPAELQQVLLDAAGSGLGLADADQLRLVAYNRRMAEWFPHVQPGTPLVALAPELQLERVRARIARGRPYRLDTVVRGGARELPVSVQITRLAGAGELLVVEVENVSRVRELEYMIESYSRMVEKQNRTLQREKERAEKLLLNIMPRRVYEEIQQFGIAAPQRFTDASVLMLDFKGFTERVESQDAGALVADLNDIFTAFDRIVEQFGCERIKTIGDAYMAVSGVPEPTIDHAHNIAKVALLLVRYIERRNRTHRDPWLCRIGISTGPVIGSIVGVQKYVYDIFGPAVNLAARLEGMSEQMTITLCDDMYEQLKSHFIMADRGEHEVRGVGRRRLYTLIAEASPAQGQTSEQTSSGTVAATV